MATEKKTHPPLPDGLPAKGAVYRHATAGHMRCMAHARDFASGAPRIVWQDIVSGDAWVMPWDSGGFSPVPASQGGTAPETAPKAAAKAKKK